MLFILFFIGLYHTQSYCTRAKGLYNQSGQEASQNNGCFSSSLYGIINCCFRCFLRGAGPNGSDINRCGSLYNYGVGECAQNPFITQQAKIDCGDSATFECFSNPGNDTSQFFGTPPPSIKPTISTTTHTPATPSNTYSLKRTIKISILLLIFFIHYIMID